MGFFDFLNGSKPSPKRQGKKKGTPTTKKVVSTPQKKITIGCQVTHRPTGDIGTVISDTSVQFAY